VPIGNACGGGVIFKTLVLITDDPETKGER